MSQGVIYVLTNPSFPEYVKIGYANNLQQRLKELNNSECLPFAFRAYCIYEVEDRLKDKDVHKLIDKLNPDLRTIENFDGKPRVREFYSISAEDAYEILYSIAAISGTTSKLKKVDPVGHEIEDEKIAEQMQEKSTSYSEENLLMRGGSSAKNLYKLLREKIVQLGDVDVQPKKLYIAFKKGRNICDVEIQRDKLKITINMSVGELNDPEGYAVDMSNKGHWGNGDYIATLTDENQLDYVIGLVKQSYDKQEIE